MELRELDPERLDGDVGLEADEAPPEPTPPKQRKKRGKAARLWLPLLAVVLCAGALALALNGTALRVKIDPLGALKRGAERVAALPDPLSLGFLGTVELEWAALGGEGLDAQSLNCAGLAALQADEAGLRLLLSDCTVGDGDFSATFSLYADPQQAAARLPDLTGGEVWYGVGLDAPLAEQGAGTGYERIYSSDQRARAQQSADGLREALSGVTALELTEDEKAALEKFLTECEKSGARAEEGYALRFTQSNGEKVRALCRGLGAGEDLLGDSLTAEFSLNRRGTLRAVAVESGNLRFTLELGASPEEELTPRLEMDFTSAEGETRALTLALTVDRAAGVAAPDYTDAFTLLPSP